MAKIDQNSKARGRHRVSQVCQLRKQGREKNPSPQKAGEVWQQKKAVLGGSCIGPMPRAAPHAGTPQPPASHQAIFGDTLLLYQPLNCCKAARAQVWGREKEGDKREGEKTEGEREGEKKGGGGKEREGEKKGREKEGKEGKEERGEKGKGGQKEKGERKGKGEDAEQRRCFRGAVKRCGRACQPEEESSARSLFYPPACCPFPFFDGRLITSFPPPAYKHPGAFHSPRPQLPSRLRAEAQPQHPPAPGANTHS